MKRLVGAGLVARLQHRTTVEGDCWIYEGPIIHFDREDGRGNYRGITLDGGGAYVAAHIASYDHHVGNRPAGWHVHHRCGQKACWRPEHLVAMEPGEHRNLHHPKKTHCPRGHEFTPDNTYQSTSDGYVSRTCRACSLESSAAWKAANPERRRELDRESARRTYARKKAEREQEAQQSEH